VEGGEVAVYITNGEYSTVGAEGRADGGGGFGGGEEVGVGGGY